MMKTILQKFQNRFVALIIEHRLAIFIVALFLTFAGFWLTFQLPLESDLAQLLPEDYVSVRTLERIKKEVGGFQTLQVLVEGPDLEVLKKYADVLASELEKSPLVKFVDYKKDVEFYRKNALLYIDLKDLETLRDRLKERLTRARLKANPFYADLEDDEVAEEEAGRLQLEDIEKKYRSTDDKIYYLHPNHRILVLNVYPTGTNSDLAFARQFFNEIQSIVERTNPKSFHPDLTIEYGGNFKNKIDEYTVLIRDVRSSVSVGLVLVFIIIMLYFRRLSAGFVIGIPLIMGLAWTFGLTYLVIGRLNTMTVFLFIVLFGLGIDFGIHLLSRFQEEWDNGKSETEALKAGLSGISRAMVIAALTTSVAFFSLMLADFRAFFEFGFIAGTGILFSLIAMMMVAPGFILFASKRRWLKPESQTLSPQLGVLKEFPYSRTILLVAAGLSLFSVFMIPRIQLEYDFSNLRSNLPESIEVKKKLTPIFRESNSPAVVLADNPEDLRELEAYISEKIKRDPTPTIDKVRTIYSMLPRDQDKKIKIIADIRRMLENETNLSSLSDEEKEKVNTLLELCKVKPLTIHDLPESIKRMFRTRDGSLGRFAYIFPSVQLRDGKNAIAFAEDVKEIRTPSGKVFHASNAAVVFSDMLQRMIEEGKRAFVLSFLAVSILVFLDLRHLLSTILVMTPLAIGILWVLGIMGFWGIRLNIFNLVIIPTIVGMGIDHGVHIFHRYVELGKGSILRVLRYTGRAVMASSITTMVGFSGLALAHHPALRSIGQLALIGLTTTLLSALIILPALLQTIEKGWLFASRTVGIGPMLSEKAPKRDSI